MSGRRVRALRSAFKKEHLRAPRLAKLIGYRDHEAVWERNELRPLKKAYARGRACR